jgi:hypothetical protein
VIGSDVEREWRDDHPQQTDKESSTMVYVCNRCGAERSWHTYTKDLEQFKNGRKHGNR